ncbi:MAG: hypothetical protein U0R64_03275 [Candidatus Nanopelagicales bacterium]
MARIILFGATGYTGRLVARDLVRTGAAPVLVGRSVEALTALVEELDDSAPVAVRPPSRSPTPNVLRRCGGCCIPPTT